MTITTRTRITATPLYPGSFFPEEGRPVEIPNAEPMTALDAMSDLGVWFAIEVRTVKQKRWTDGGGGELWQDFGYASSYRIYVGEARTAEQVERLDDGQDHSILLANMRGNDWDRVVRTRRGNWQPIEPRDVVIAPAEASR